MKTLSGPAAAAIVPGRLSTLQCWLYARWIMSTFFSKVCDLISSLPAALPGAASFNFITPRSPAAAVNNGAMWLRAELARSAPALYSLALYNMDYDSLERAPLIESPSLAIY